MSEYDERVKELIYQHTGNVGIFLPLMTMEEEKEFMRTKYKDKEDDFKFINSKEKVLTKKLVK